MNHKRHKPKQARAGCLLCKPYKITQIAGADRKKRKIQAFKHEERAY